MFTLYIDDSGTDPDQNVAILAAWIAPSKLWLRFEADWKRFMAKEGFECFHAADIFHGSKEFKDWDYEKKERVFRKLRQLIKRYVSHGIAIAMFKKDFDEVVTGEFREMVGNYHFTIGVRSLLGDVKRWRKTRPHHDKFEYVFDWMDPRSEARKEIEAFLSVPHLAVDALESFGGYEGFYSFGKRRDLAPLQAADLLAWITFQAAKKKYQGNPVRPIAEEAILDFDAMNNGNGPWLDIRIWERNRLRDWVKDVHQNGIFEGLKNVAKIREALDAEQKPAKKETKKIEKPRDVEPRG